MILKFGKLVGPSAGGAGGASPFSAGGSYDTLTLSDVGNSAYEKTYTRMTNNLFGHADYFGLALEVTPASSTHASFAYYTGSSWYVVVWDDVESEWTIGYTSTDPETLVLNDSLTYASGFNRQPSVLQGSTDDNGVDVPLESLTQVTYS